MQCMQAEVLVMYAFLFLMLKFVSVKLKTVAIVCEKNEKKYRDLPKLRAFL
jgi:hypothetical protein